MRHHYGLLDAQHGRSFPQVINIDLDRHITRRATSALYLEGNSARAVMAIGLSVPLPYACILVFDAIFDFPLI